MPAPDRRRMHRHTVRPAPALQAAAWLLWLPGCSAMGELVYHRPLSWLAATVAVLVVVGFIVSRMRR